MTIRAASELDTELSYIPTGIPSYDRLLGGGIARGKITLISGQPSVGKSTLCYSAIAEAQKLGLKPLLYDVEHSYDASYSATLGIDPTKLFIVREEYGEEGLDTLLEAIESGEYQLIVIDSIGALLPRAVGEKSVGEKTIGSQASLVSTFIRRAVSKLSLKNVALVCLTHEFNDIMSGGVKASGGAKLMYHTSVHIRLKQKFGTVLKSGDQTIGKVIVAEVKKNKLGPSEAKTAEAQFIYGEAFSKSADLLDSALDAGLIEKRGTVYWMGTEKLGMISKLRLLMKDEDFSEKIKAQLA